MAGDSTIRFTAPAGDPVEPPPARTGQPVSDAPTFALGARVRRGPTRWPDGGEVVGIRETEAGLVHTVRRWSDKSLYDATAAELTPDPVMFPNRPC